MTLIVLLVSLAIERFWGQIANYRDLSWVSHWSSWINKLGWPGDKSVFERYLKLAVMVVPILIIVLILAGILGAIWQDLLTTLLAIVILIYMMGPGNIFADITQCQAKEDAAQNIFGVDGQNDPALLATEILSTANQRIFAPIFWFIILGPIGAVLYRLCHIYSRDEKYGLLQEAAVVVGVLDWIPARLLGFTYGLVGHFSRVLPQWTKALLKGPQGNNELLTHCSQAALRDKLQDKQVALTESANLLERSVVAWVIVIAIVLIL